MFGDLVRDKTYRGPDKSYLSKAEIGAAKPVDHGIKTLLGKFSQFNLSYLTPEQRKKFVEQVKYESTLTASELNQYLSERYSEDDMYEIWQMQRKAQTFRGKKLPVTRRKDSKRLKQNISRKKRKPMTPEQIAERTAKARATRERNKQDPNYVSYGMLKREFLKKQKLLADRIAPKLEQAVEVYSDKVINQKVAYRTAKLAMENQHLKEYIRMNNLPLPGSRKAKMRRQGLRQNND